MMRVCQLWPGLALALSLHAAAVETSFVFSRAPLSGFAGDGAACNQSLYEPYVWALMLDSKYDQSDSTKSTYTSDESSGSIEAKD
ncbi:MAG: hypothetical protein OXE99_01300, partial [Cellvibrionales bacterium]|nr:hypothetical protein [Cellvibrionales bacterium]